MPFTLACHLQSYNFLNAPRYQSSNLYANRPSHCCKSGKLLDLKQEIAFQISGLVPQRAMVNSVFVSDDRVIHKIDLSPSFFSEIE